MASISFDRIDITASREDAGQIRKVLTGRAATAFDNAMTRLRIRPVALGKTPLVRFSLRVFTEQVILRVMSPVAKGRLSAKTVMDFQIGIKDARGLQFWPRGCSQPAVQEQVDANVRGGKPWYEGVDLE